jgi:phosphonate transport system permease protein
VIAAVPVQVPVTELPSRRFRRRATAVTAGTALLVAALVYLKADPVALIRDFHYVVDLLGQMLPPNFALWRQARLWTSLLETISMAFLATLGGATMALVLAVFGATNTSPHWALRMVVRSGLTAERCTPNFVVLLILLIAVGIGPFAAMLSLLIGSLGMFGKLFADAIEQIDRGPLEAIAAAGASRLQIIRYAVMPQVAPSIVANVFYAFDVNLRAAVALGVFGGGGIGFELNVARSVLRYQDMFACLILIIVMITVMERVADFFRRRILSLEGVLN